ncbi:hypothetical protein BKA61DRAFT_575039 [Leptodontidium sp. MPI-SDFR-AT-0119]|nr:hypothetical protein BKA61DRAFT_575039 [Leptodontidium sp. MPI-SDFR-AT-0119]
MDERPEKPRTEDQSRLPFSVDADTANRCQAAKKRINENQSLQLTHIFHSSSSPPARRRQPVPDSTAKHLLHQIANHCGCVKILTSPSSSALQSMMRTGWAKASESMAEAYSCNKTYVLRNLQSDSHRTFATLTVYFKSPHFVSSGEARRDLETSCGRIGGAPGLCRTAGWSPVGASYSLWLPPPLAAVCNLERTFKKTPGQRVDDKGYVS